MKSRFLALLLVMVLALGALSACGGGEEPADTTDEAAQEGQEMQEELEETDDEMAETDDEAAPAGEGGQITFWSTEEQPERAAATEAIIAACQEQTGVGAELVLTNEDDLPSLVTSSVAAGSLPDIAFFPMDFAIGWAEQGLLDTQAATEMIESLGVETFAEGPLNLVAYEEGYAAVPADGWGQLLVYRQDLFDEMGLETPDTYERIEAAAAALHDPSNNFYGITAANDPSAVFTQQTFEHIALANGCRLVEENGDLAIDSPACVEAVDFFANLLNNYAPAGVQDVESTRATYFAGQAGMVVWSPFILDEMAGLRDEAFPACPECADDPAFLAKNSGIVPAIQGPSGEEPAQYGQVSYLGIMTGADVESSKTFMDCFFNDGYLDWLAMAPEGKFPMRLGTPEEPDLFLEGWQTLETGVDRKMPLGEVYGEDVIQVLVEGAGSFKRWGFGLGQGALVGPVYEALVVPQLLNDVLTGSMTAEQAVGEMAAEIEDLR